MPATALVLPGLEIDAPLWQARHHRDPAALALADRHYSRRRPGSGQVGPPGRKLVWPQIARLLRGLRPRWVLLENVPGLLARGFGDVLADLAALGYDAEWACLAAADVGAPHLRERVFVVAYPDSRGGHGLPERLDPQDVAADAGQRGQGTMADPDRPGLEVLGVQPARSQRPAAERGRPAVADPTGRRGARRAAGPGTPDGWRPLGLPERPGRGCAEPVLGGVLDGLPARVDRHRWPAPPGQPQHPHEPPRTVRPRTVPDRAARVSALGNAVVPQVVELIGRAIRTAHQHQEGMVG